MSASVHVVLGQRGKGKSRLLRKLCEESGNRRIVLDTLREHASWAPCRDLEYFRQALLTLERYDMSVSPLTRAQAEYVIGACAARCGITLAIDELDYWYPSSTATLCFPLQALVRYGRHYDQTLIVTARRPQAIGREITSQGILWCFPMVEPRDLDYVRQFASFDVSELGESGDEIQVLRADGGDSKVLTFNRRTLSLSA